MLAKKGCNMADLTRGNMMLEAAQLGLINVVKALESQQFKISFQNNFGEGLLHYAAKGNQDRMVHYLLLRKVDPNMLNKFKESAIFVAAEMGSMEVLLSFYSDKRTKVDLIDKFGDNILHFAARDG